MAALSMCSSSNRGSKCSGLEGAGDLGVEIDAINHNHHGGVLQCWVQPQLAGGEQHQQRLARALKVPDESLLGMPGHHALDDLVCGLVLLMAGDDLDAPLL